VGSNPSHLHRPQSKPKQAMQAESMSAVLMQQTINLKAASGMKTEACKLTNYNKGGVIRAHVDAHARGTGRLQVGA